MGENTKIEWADHTMNFWIGCQAISPGCDHCYAESYAKRVGRDFAQRTRTSANNWNQPLKWARAAERMGRRFRVFTNSLADFFDNEVPAEWRRDALAMMVGCSNLDWLVLTKRIGNAQRMLDEAIRSVRFASGCDDFGNITRAAPMQSFRGSDFANIWIGATVVNQEEADRDIPKLLAVDARVRFLSIEPMLGPMDVSDALNGYPVQTRGRQTVTRDMAVDAGDRSLEGSVVGEDEWERSAPPLDWVIAGGESGHHARPMHYEWITSLRDQCTAASVPFLFKQWGEWGRPTPAEECDCDKLAFGERLHRVNDIVLHRIGKKDAGRDLDGRTHDEFPR